MMPEFLRKVNTAFFPASLEHSSFLGIGWLTGPLFSLLLSRLGKTGSGEGRVVHLLCLGKNHTGL